MRRILSLLFFLAILADGFAAPPAAGFPWEQFKPRPLRTALASDAEAAAKMPVTDHRVVFSGQGSTWRTTVTFAGDTRPLAPEKRELIERWALLNRASRDFAGAYEQEYLFVEHGHKYWLALQKQLVAPLLRDATKNQPFDIFYFTGIGGLQRDADWDWAILVAEFQKQK